MTTYGCRVLLCVTVTAATTGCALPFMKKAPPPPAPPAITIAAPAEVKAKASMTLTAGADVNPDRAGSARPVKVRVYQLKADAVFKDAQFDPLFDDDKKVLGELIVTRDDFTLGPGEKRTLEVSLDPTARFVGVFAEFFRALGKDSQWHAVVPASRKSFVITLTGSRVSLTGTE